MQKIRIAASASSISNVEEVLSNARRDERTFTERVASSTNSADALTKSMLDIEKDIQRVLQLKWGQITASNMQQHEAQKARMVAERMLHYCIYGNALATKRASNPASNTTENNSVQTGQQNQINQQTQGSQQAQQTQQLAAQNQARADQARQGKRKTHEPAAEAHECIAIDNAGSGNFGAFKNTCSYRVNFYTCNYKPRVTQGGFNWSADFDCEKQQHGMHTPGAGVAVAAHNRNTETVHWFACKAPASPVDVSFVQGQGLSGRCN